MKEKISNATQLFLNYPYNAMVRQALYGGQEVARRVPKFAETGNGAIVMMCVPLSWEADGWFGNLSEFDNNRQFTNVHKYVHVATVSPQGSQIIQWEDPNDHHTEPVNCYAYAMAKIAYLEHLVEKNIPNQYFDEEAEQFMEENGFSRHQGGVCSTYYFNDEPLMRIYDAFSGASEDEDLRCAIEVAKNRLWTMKQFTEEVSCAMWSVLGCIV